MLLNLRDLATFDLPVLAREVFLLMLFRTRANMALSLNDIDLERSVILCEGLLGDGLGPDLICYNAFPVARISQSQSVRLMNSAVVYLKPQL